MIGGDFSQSNSPAGSCPVRIFFGHGVIRHQIFNDRMGDRFPGSLSQRREGVLRQEGVQSMIQDLRFARVIGADLGQQGAQPLGVLADGPAMSADNRPQFVTW